ncbi:MAG: hypothetical protein ACK2TV_14120 [Anaerolineales bacterium]
MKPELVYQSYLVRLWREEQVGGRGEPPAWQGELLHIQTGQKWPLHDVKEVLNSIKITIENK